MNKTLKSPDDQYRQYIAELSNRYQRNQKKRQHLLTAKCWPFTGIWDGILLL